MQEQPLSEGGRPMSRLKLNLLDFQLGGQIYPTPVLLLHQGTDVLVYRSADQAKGITRAQHRLFHMLARLGESPDAPGSVTTIVATGAHGVTYDRQIAVYDHMHNEERLRLAGDREIPDFITNWFRVRERQGR